MIQQTGRKLMVMGCVITALAAIWLIISMIFSNELNNYFSTFRKVKSAGENFIHYYSDSNQRYELGVLDTLVLPISFDAQLFRVGVFMGEQQLAGTDKYVFQLEDEFCNVLGKTVVGIDQIQPDSFVYINADLGVIDTEQTYYLKIFSENPDENKVPLNLSVSDADSFQTVPFSVNNIQGDKTVILEYHYQVVNKKIVLLINLVLISIVVIYWGLYIFCIIMPGTLKKIKGRFHVVLEIIPWRKINIYAVLMIVFLNILMLLLPATSYNALGGNERFLKNRESVVPLKNDVVIEQNIAVGEGIMDSFGVMFATYNQRIHGGTVHVEMWDKSEDQLLYSEEVRTDKIDDNQYIYFDLLDSVNLESRSLVLRLHAELLSDNDALAVYLNDNYSDTMYAEANGIPLNGSIAFRLCESVKQQRTGFFIIADCLLLVLLLVYVVCFTHFRNDILKYAVLTFLLTLLFYLPVCSFITYGEVSMNSMESVLKNRNKLSAFKQYDEAELTDALLVEKKYDFKGELFEVREYTDIPYGGVISSISLDIVGSKMLPKDYGVQVYWDSGDGFNDAQVYTYKYVHHGGDNITFSVPCSDIVYRIRVAVGLATSRAYSLPERLMPLKSLQINSQDGDSYNDGANMLKSVIIFGGVLIFCAVACIWKYLCVDEKLYFFFEKKNLSISRVFIFLASVYGVCLVFLVPTRQIMDESTHIEMLYSDLGDSSMAGKLNKALGDQGISGVMNMAGQNVDVPKYISAAKNKLDDYSFHRGVPSVKLIRRPGQAVGVTIGQMLHLPAYWILQCGELGALAVYIILGAMTLKIMPYKKNLMMAIMLLPVSIQQGGSISYDSFNNAIAFLAIAYILHLKVDADKISWRQIVNLAVLAVLLLLGKVIYVLLIGLIFIIPQEKFELRVGKVIIDSSWLKKHKIMVIIFVLATFPVGVLAAFSILPALGYDNIAERSIGIILNFSQFFRLLCISVSTHYKMWLFGATGNLGWTDVPVNDAFIWLMVVSLFVFALMHHKQCDADTLKNRLDDAGAFSVSDIIVCYGTFVLISIAIVMSMVNWGFFIFGVDTGSVPMSNALKILMRVEGVQGRYFIPILPLLFLPLHTKKNYLGFIPRGLYKLCYYILVIIYPVTLLLARYWGIGVL